MARYEFSQGASSKFWEIELTGKSFTTTYGKIGSAGQRSVKELESAAEAKKEHDKLVAEKLKKGYVVVGMTPNKAVTKAATKTVKSIYLDALLALLRSHPKRKKPNATLAAWAKRERRPDLRSLFEVFAEHGDGGASVGDFILTEGGRVPRADDSDRDDVICIGNSGGGDLYVVAVPGTDDTSVTRLIHDRWFSDGDSYRDLDQLLRECVTANWEDGGATALDDGLERVGIVSPQRIAVREARAAELAKNESGGFALVETTAKLARPNGAAARLFHRETHPRAVGAYFVGWDRDFKLAIVDAKTGQRVDTNVQAYWYAGSFDGTRVLATGQGGIFEIDLAAPNKPRLLSDARPFYAACYLGDRVAALFAGTGFSTSLELYGRNGNRLTALAKPTRCDGTKKLSALADGRLLVVFDDTREAPCHFLGVRGDELRLLGTVRGIEDAWDSTDGRACFVKTDKTVLELRDVDGAIARAFAKSNGLLKLS